jgi:hypothetical protein
MKNILLLLTVIAVNVHAESVDDTIGKACLKQAVSLTQQLKTDIYPDMDKEQANKIIRLSTENCKQQFAAKENQQVVSQGTGEKNESKSTDWFTEKVLSGEPAGKAGNKRLKRMQTR